MAKFVATPEQIGDVCAFMTAAHRRDGLMSRRLALYRAGFTVSEIRSLTGPGSTGGYYLPWGFLSYRQRCADPLPETQHAADELFHVLKGAA